MFIFDTPGQAVDSCSAEASLRSSKFPTAAGESRESSPSWTALASTISTAKSSVFKRKQTPLAADRKTSLTVEVTKQQFYDFRDVLTKYAIQSDDVWNMDESGFRIEVERGHLVITLIKKRPLRAIDPGVRGLVSDVEAISAARGKIPPMLIVPGINILNK